MIKKPDSTINCMDCEEPFCLNCKKIGNPEVLKIHNPRTEYYSVLPEVESSDHHTKKEFLKLLKDLRSHSGKGRKHVTRRNKN